MKKNWLIWALLCVLCVSIPGLAENNDLAEDAMTLIQQVMDGEVDAYYDRLTPEAQAAMPRDVMAGIGGQLAAGYGTLDGFGAAQVIGSIVVVELDMTVTDLLGQVSYDEAGRIAGILFAPDTRNVQAPALRKGEEEVAVGQHALEGVLALPEGEGPFPAVVLVHGSGANDRNETIGTAAPFLDLAEGLVAKGIAVLRYDKRAYAIGQGKISISQEALDDFTVYHDTIEDAVAGVQLLKEDARIDPDRVYVLGHSQGGMLANSIQGQDADAAGLIIWAGTLRNLSDVYLDQLMNLDDGSEAVAAEMEAVTALIAGMTEEEARETIILQTNGYFWWDERQRDYTAIAAAEDVPMLIMQGTEDQNVFADIDYPLWEDFAAEHPERDITLKLYEGLGHSFLDSEHVSAQVIEDIAEWILQR